MGGYSIRWLGEMPRNNDQGSSPFRALELRSFMNRRSNRPRPMWYESLSSAAAEPLPTVRSEHFLPQSQEAAAQGAFPG